MVFQRKGDSMNAVFTALSVLSSITGFASGQRFDTSKDLLMDCMTEHFGELSPFVKEESIVSTDDVYDMDGSNRYVLLSFFDNSFVIYDKKDEIILKTYDANPYEGFEDSFKLLGNIENKYMYAYFNEEVNDFTFINNTCMSKEELHLYFTNQGYSYGNYYRDVAKPSNVHIIQDAFYFEKLGNNHAPNTDGTCAVISTEILLSYYDTFVNDRVIDDVYENVEEESISKATPAATDFIKSPGVDSVNNTRFHDYLYRIACDEVKDDPKNSGMSVSNQKQLVKKYLEKRGITHVSYSSDGNFSDLIGNKAKKVIKDAIDQNRPVIACGEGHASVAYAYSDTMVWVHTGWGYTAATPWRTFESGMFYNYSAGAIDIANICSGVHACSDNYLASNTNTYVCPKCGAYKRTEIAQNGLGISDEFSTTGQTKYFTLDSANIHITYIRAAVLSADTRYLTLSPKKQGEGFALVEYWVTKPIRYIEFKVCLFGYSEGIDSSNTTVMVHAIRPGSSQGTYMGEAIDSLLDRNISKNRNSPTTLSYSFAKNDNVVGFRVMINSPATGTTDSGRVCISNLLLKHSTVNHGYFSR